MTKAKGKIAIDSGQLSLLDLLKQEKEQRAEERPGHLCVASRLVGSVREAIKRASKSRETIADEMAHMTGQTVTVHMLNSWTAASHPHRIPAELLHALCRSCGTVEPVRILAEAAGVYTMPAPDALRAEVQKLREEEAKLAVERKRREVFLRELER